MSDSRRRSSTPPQAAQHGPAKPIRHYRLPPTWRGRLWDWRWLILRRVGQLLVLLLFLGTVRWGWELAGRPVLTGNLSSSELLGFLPLADPFATLQILATGHGLDQPVLIGALVILVLYALLGGRTFCAWVCPINPVTDLAGWLRNRLGLKDTVRVGRRVRYAALALSLVLSALTGVAAFEWVSPISMAHREIVFGIGLGWAAVLLLFLLDLLLLKHGWCGHLCPLGAFYGLLGRTALLRVRFDKETCTHCTDCIRVCPEPQVLDLKKAAQRGYIASGECTNCGRCTPICPENSLTFDWRPLIRRHSDTRRPASAATAADDPH
jgi:ferredoxin-type protein NapH